MKDQHYIVAIYLGNSLMTNVDVVAAHPEEAKAIAASQIRLKASKGYAKIEVPKATEVSGLPSFRKPAPRGGGNNATQKGNQ